MAEMTLGQDAMAAGMRKVYFDALGAPGYFFPHVSTMGSNAHPPTMDR
jgi:hypothetical protein